jgi:hypothetical protein
VYGGREGAVCLMTVTKRPRVYRRVGLFPIIWVARLMGGREEAACMMVARGRMSTTKGRVLARKGSFN